MTPSEILNPKQTLLRREAEAMVDPPLPGPNGEGKLRFEKPRTQAERELARRKLELLLRERDAGR